MSHCCSRCVCSDGYYHKLNYVFVLNVAIVLNYCCRSLTEEFKLDDSLGDVLMISWTVMLDQIMSVVMAGSEAWWVTKKCIYERISCEMEAKENSLS